MLKAYASMLLLIAIRTPAQNGHKNVALTQTSTISPKDIEKALQKECPEVSVTQDASRSDYTLEAVKMADVSGQRPSFSFTLFDHDGKAIRNTLTYQLSNAAKDICHAVKTTVMVEVVDTQNLTQSQDTRGDTSGGLVGATANSLTGRRTHTDTSTISVIVNGEHAVLDCYERRTGCTTIAPGKYYGELDGESVWVTYEMPLTHKPVRNHYKIAGSW